MRYTEIKIRITQEAEYERIRNCILELSPTSSKEWYDRGQDRIIMFPWIFIKKDLSPIFSTNEFPSMTGIEYVHSYEMIDISYFDEDPLINWEEVEQFREQSIKIYG